jgi:hypothetical protein
MDDDKIVWIIVTLGLIFFIASNIEEHQKCILLLSNESDT